MTIGEARELLSTRAKFGDAESIEARDLLRLAEDISDKEIYVVCQECEGSGVTELNYNDAGATNPCCFNCDGSGEAKLCIYDTWTYGDLVAFEE